MNTEAANELLNIILRDDYVSRREGLNTWTRRWIATMQISHPVNKDMVEAAEQLFPGRIDELAKQALAQRMAVGLVANEVKAVSFVIADGEKIRVTSMEMHIILQEPRTL